MPTRAQAARARETVMEARARLKGVLVIDYVPADHHAQFPKACMGGWGSTGLNIAPDGPCCPATPPQTIPGLVFERVGDRPLRGDLGRRPRLPRLPRRGLDAGALPQSCDRRRIDFGGCRCQAMALAGDPAATDPVCSKSPLHAALVAAAEADAAAAPPPFTYRRHAGAGAHALRARSSAYWQVQRAW